MKKLTTINRYRINSLPLWGGLGWGLILALLLSTSAAAQQFTICALPDSIDAHGQDLVLLRLSHYDTNGDTLTGTMVVNRRIATATCEVFRELYAMRYPIERMELAQRYRDDEVSMRANNTSAYLYRTIAGTNRLSKHAQGLAIDINPLYNPCFKVVNGKPTHVQPATAKRYADRTKTYPCTVTQKVVDIFRRHGFSWGGSWRTKKDYQHFEAM